jgi:hypothetical protein
MQGLAIILASRQKLEEAGRLDLYLEVEQEKERFNGTENLFVDSFDRVRLLCGGKYYGRVAEILIHAALFDLDLDLRSLETVQLELSQCFGVAQAKIKPFGTRLRPRPMPVRAVRPRKPSRNHLETSWI